jgi:hypothetical protein
MIVSLVSGCTGLFDSSSSSKDKPSTVKDIPEKTDSFPNNFTLISTRSEDPSNTEKPVEYYQTVGDITLIIRGQNHSGRQLYTNFEYSEGDFMNPVGLPNFVDVNGSLAWQRNGSIFMDGKKVAAAKLPFEVNGKLGYVNDTSEGDKIVVLDSDLPKFDLEANSEINDITYSEGSFFYLPAESEKVYRNNEVLIDDHLGNEVRSIDGDLYVKAMDEEKIQQPKLDGRNSNLTPFTHYQHVKNLKRSHTFFDMTQEGPLYSKNFVGYQKVYRGPEMVDVFHHNMPYGTFLQDAVQTDSGIAYVVNELVMKDGQYRQGSTFVYINGEYYGPYDQNYLTEFDEVNGDLIYQATAKGKNQTFLVTKNPQSWMY